MKKREKIVIFGAGGHGRVVLDILAEAGADTAGFIDEDIQKAGSIINGFKVLGDWKYLEGRKDLSVALGIGDNEMR
ncbi:MAG: transferase, partial [Candidatus Omnitrophica bacterium]|nr:transferase [Candidatus Omnitrophota bacterium]